MILFQHPEVNGGHMVILEGFKLDDMKQRCEDCGRTFPRKEIGTLTITQGTGHQEKHFLCLECGKKLIEKK